MVEDRIPAVAELERPLERVLDELYTNVVSNVYGAIIGEDRGGRIPALILRRAINKINVLREKSGIPIVFIQGFRHTNEYEYFEEGAKFATDFLYAQTTEQNKKALLVTEYIGEGITLRNFSKLLRRCEVKFDAAAVKMLSPEKHYQNFIPNTSDLYAGNLGTPPELSGHSPLSGLYKDSLGQRRAISYSYGHQQVTAARQDANIIADSIAGRVLFRRGR